MYLQLTIIYRHRGVVFVYIDEEHNVEKVKHRISKVTGLPTHVQKLYFGGNELKNSRSLKSYGLPKRCGLLLQLAQGYALRFQIYVRAPHNTKNPIRIRIGLGTTLRQIRRALSAATQIPSDLFVLATDRQIFSNKVEDTPLVDLGVKSNDVLNMIVRE